MPRKKVIVSGAASGIGAAAALRFAREGWDVCLTDIQESKMSDIFSKLKQGEHLMVSGDYTDANTTNALADKVEKQWGKLDALVSCAGIFSVADAVKSALDEWRMPFDSMINGTVNLTRASAPLMKNGGRIIYITSIHGERAEVGSSSYAMAKAALNQYCRGLAVELASDNILVNAIAPGFIDTPMNLVNGENTIEGEWFQKNYVEGHHLPLKRVGKPEEVAGVALFLAGPDASYITGQVITVDGGLLITF